MTDTPSSQNPGVLANILAVAGFIILIVIILWGAYHLLRLTGSGVSNLFSIFSRENAITLTLPNAAVASGSIFPVSWKYAPEVQGSYAFLYQCKTGLRIDLNIPGGKTAIPCGTAYTVGTSTSISVVATSAGTSSLDVPVSVVFIPAATSTTERPQGTGTIKIAAKNDSNGGTAPAASAAPAATTPTSTAQPAGKPDLSVRILAIGVINPMTGLFETRYPSGPQEVAAVKFDIANNGSSATGNYYFSATLPVSGGYTYTSPLQASLSPGSRIENILRFSPVVSSGGMLTISIDTTHAVNELNESNNSAGMYVSAPVWTGSYAPYVY